MSDASARRLPLAGLRVLDLTNNVAGPFATLILADLGADVLKVERPKVGDDGRHLTPIIDGESSVFEAMNRGKGSIAIDLKTTEGQELCRKLAARSDVFIESMRPGKLAELGLGPDELETVSPHLIYCSISGFGHTGPMRQNPGYDMLIQARTGIMDITGEEGGSPVRVGPSIVDIGTGIWAGLTVLAALRERDNNGSGFQHLDVSLFDTGVAWMTLPVSQYLATGELPKRLGGRTPIAAPADIYPTSDGYVTVSILNDTIWQTFVSLIGVDSRFSGDEFSSNVQRVARTAELTDELRRVFRTRTTQEWLDLLDPHGVTIQKVRGVDDLLADEQADARGLLREAQTEKGRSTSHVRLPFANSGFGAEVSTAAPALGRDTTSALRELGLADDEIARLTDDGIVGAS